MAESLQMEKKTTAKSLPDVGLQSNAVLFNWSEGLDATPANIGNGVDQGQSKARAKKHVSLTPRESSDPIAGTKDPTKPLKSDAQLRNTVAYKEGSGRKYCE